MGLFDEMMLSNVKNNGLISGIVTGTVKDNYNKDYPGMVKVELFLGEEGKNVTGWVAVMSPYAGANFGFYALPEVGSEVVVAFNMGDRNRPVVIGSLWSGKNKLPKGSATEKNTVKQLITKGGNEIVIDDTQNKQKITLKTKKEKVFILDEDKNTITLSDKGNKNGITIDSAKGQVTVTADKKLVLKVGGSAAVTVDGTGKKITLKSATVALNADNQLDLKGQNVKLSGTAVKVNGSSSLQMSSSGSTQVKGAIVKIN